MIHHSFQGVKLGSHFLLKELHFGVIDNVQSFLKFVLVVHRGHLQVTLDLLSDLLETVDYRDAGYGVNTIQRLQTHAAQLVFPRNLSEMNYRLENNHI